MIINTTYHNKEDLILVDNKLGKPYSFLQRIKLKGVGSSRLVVAKISNTLQVQQLQFNEINYANIELRPKGIIVHFTNRLQKLAWIIPYYKLHTYKTKYFSIHADGHFVSFKKDAHYRSNINFLNKMIDTKIKHLQLEYYDG